LKKEINELINLLRKNDFQEILKKKDILHSTFPDNEIVFDILGIALLNTGYYEDAIKSFKRALVINPNFIQSYNNLGNLLDNLERYEEAIEYFTGGLDIDPYNQLILNNIAQSLSSIGKLTESVIYYKKVLQLNPNFFQAHNSYGNTLVKLGLYEEAIIHYKKSLEIEPGYFKAHNNLGVIFSIIGEIDKSIKSYESAIKINPNYAPTYWNMHGCCKDMDEAISLLRKCVDLDSNYKKAYLTLAFLEAYLGNTYTYLEISRSSLKKNPYMRSFEWIFSLPKLPQLFFSRWSFFDEMINLSLKSRPFYEFGVWMGVSFKYLMKSYKSGYGFDTFRGLTEDWYNEPKGYYSSQNEVPNIDGGNFIVGEFKDTLPTFFSKKRPKASIINFDADLYTSTLCALENSLKIVDSKTILIFDELIVNDSWENDEFKALTEFTNKYNLEYEVIAISIFTKQVALRFLDI